MYYLAFPMVMFSVCRWFSGEDVAFGWPSHRFDSGRHPPELGTPIRISDLRSSLRLSLALRASMVLQVRVSARPSSSPIDWPTQVAPSPDTMVASSITNTPVHCVHYVFFISRAPWYRRPCNLAPAFGLRSLPSPLPA